MKLILLFSLFLFHSCGKIEKFSRLDEGYTRVYLDQDPRLATMDGGLMVYFVSSTNEETGRAFGFADRGAALARSVIVPNGSYRVFFLGTTGANKIEGQAKCGKANNGNPISLVGGSATITVDLTAGHCGFGTESEFGKVNSANSGNSNFDTLDFNFCNGAAYPSCSAATLANYRVRLNLLGGIKPSTGSFTPIPSESVTSGCSSATSVGTINSSFIAFTGGNTFSPPMQVLIYSDATCSGSVVGTINLTDGLKTYLSVSSGSNVYVDSPSTSNVTYLKFNFP